MVAVCLGASEALFATRRIRVGITQPSAWYANRNAWNDTCAMTFSRPFIIVYAARRFLSKPSSYDKGVKTLEGPVICRQPQ